MASVPLFWGTAHRFFCRPRVVGRARLQVAPLLLVTSASKYAWRAVLSMRISLWVHIRRVVEAVALPNRIGEKWRRTSDVRGFVRAGLRRCPRVAVAGRRDGYASPDRLRTSRYASCHDVCIVSLSGKSQYCASVCNVVIQCLLAIWLILSLVSSVWN